MDIKVFLFHRINPNPDPIWPPITPIHFEQIITHLTRNFEIVPLEETILGKYIPTTSKKLCAITFDDGYKDFTEYAMPIITKYKIPTSVYIITDCVRANSPPWTYTFNHLLLNTNRSSLEVDSAEIPQNLRKIKWNTFRKKVAYIKYISHILKRISDEERENVMQQIRNQVEDVGNPYGLMMNWNDIRAIKGEGIEIGSHSTNHPILSKEIRLDSIKHEFKKSGEEIEKETGKFPLAISYPFGIYNNEAKKIAKEVGYKMGLTVFPKKYSLSEDRFEIPRIELYNEHFYKSILRINGQLQVFKNLFYKGKSLNSNG